VIEEESNELLLESWILDASLPGPILGVDDRGYSGGGGAAAGAGGEFGV
jgi:hypothetical protein